MSNNVHTIIPYQTISVDSNKQVNLEWTYDNCTTPLINLKYKKKEKINE